MFRRLLVPLDGSPFAETALPTALTLARRGEGEIRLLSVIDTHGDPGGADGSEMEEYLADARRRAAAGWYGPITTTVRSGRAAEQIGAELDEWNADLLVIATHGRSGISRAWMGSVAEQCIHAAHRPVLAIRPPAEPSDAHAGLTLARVVVPLDGSTQAEAALPHAVVLAREFGVPLLLLRAVTPSKPMDFYYLPETIAMSRELDEEAKERASAYVQEVVARLSAAGIEVGGIVTTDVSAQQAILEHAEGGLIAMTTRGRGGVGRALLGSVADKVMRGGGGGLLVVPPAAQAAKQEEERPPVPPNVAVIVNALRTSR